MVLRWTCVSSNSFKIYFLFEKPVNFLNSLNFNETFEVYYVYMVIM